MKINILHWPADPAVKIDVHTFDIVFVSARHGARPPLQCTAVLYVLYTVL